MDVIQFFTKNRKLLRWGFLVLILILVITLPLYGGPYHTSVLTFALVYVVLAVSWAMFSGTTGYMSLAPAAFFGIGVYSMAILQDELPFPIIMVIGGLVSFAFALLIGLVTLRLKGIYFAIFTFGLVVFMSELINYLETSLRGTHGWHITIMNHAMLLYVALGLVVVTVLAIYFIRRSRYGLAMLSIGGNEEAAAHMGVDTTKVKVFSFAISALFMGVAGVIAAPKLIYVNTNIAFSTTYSFMPILMAVFGGMGQLYGPVVGAVVFAYLDTMIRNEFPRYFLIIFGVTLVMVILFLPNGIAGLMPMLQDKLWGPVRALRKERTWKPTAAGILSILGGICQLIMAIILLIGVEFIREWGWFSAISALVSLIGILFIALGIVAILGGICALRRSSWRLALAGSICALIGPGFFGIPAVIFNILGKSEFQYGMEGGQTEQHANT